MLRQVGRWSVACRLVLIFGFAAGAGSARAAFTITDFAVDPAHATLGNPHEVASPDFDYFQLTIYGTFATNKCYEVTIKHEGGGPCGSANSSGTDTAVVFADHLVADISPNANADFKAAHNWRIEVKERNAGCSGSGTVQTFPDDPGEPYLKIRGCSDSCTLTQPSIIVTPNPVGCGDMVTICVTAGGTGNHEYDWDLDGDGTCGVCSSGTNNGGKCAEDSDCPGGACVGGGGFDDLTTNTGDAGCLIDQPCCVTTTITTTHTVGVKITDKQTNIPCTACGSTLVTVVNDCSDGLFCNGTEVCDADLGCQPGTPPNCDDGVACTVDSCNEANDTCVHTPNNAACSDGLFCNGSETCHPTLGCQPGTPPNCNDGVSCTTDTCNEATDSCDHTPNNAICSDGAFCNGTETCDPVNGCQAGTPPNCNDGVGCTADSCNETTDTCDHAPNNALCENGQFCDGAEVCDLTNGCQDGPDPNCNDGVSCTLDSCNETTDSCDHSPDNGLCNDGAFCNGNETCHATLGCQAGTAPDCDDGVACTGDSCNESTDTCDHTPNDAACSDGAFCNGSETCHPVNGCEAGTPPNCNDNVACTVDACDEAGDTCTHTPNHAACDNGLHCDGAEVCDPTAGCQDSPDPNCDDGVACTIDSCDEDNDACSNVPSNVFCDDGAFCDGAEYCDATLGCQDAADPCSAPLKCDEANDRCVSCLSDAQCNDGLHCNGVETCNATTGTCQAGTPPNCDDGVACTVDSCNETTDSCDHLADDGACSNGLFCDGVEVCHPTLGCQDGPDPNCDDGVACTIDSCNESTDTCDHAPSDAACSDAAFCNGAETCHPTNGCQAGSPPNCDDGVTCTIDACDEANDTCTHTPNALVCDNGLYCDGAEVCHPTAGCQDGPDPNCDDGVACTQDACDENNDVCEHPPDHAFCSDGAFCNGAEVCDPVNGCQAGTPPNCSDGVSCTVDTCDETNDVCVYTPSDSLCDDMLYCTGVETCHPVNGCQDGADPNCNDGVGCTVDACDEATDSCTHTPDDNACDDTLFCDGDEFCHPTLGCQDAADPCSAPLKCDEPNDRCVSCLSDTQCNDGLFCNGVETCNTTTGMCVAGTPPSCDDGVSCTVDACSPASDSCTHTPDHGACSNGMFCDGDETCDAVGGCQPGTPPNCDDGVACTVDSCDETNDTCQHAATDSLCSNGLFCDGAETCHPTLGCQAGTAPNCDDGVSCTIDSCNESTDMCDHAPSDTLCSDGLFCTGVETCDVMSGCQDGPDPTCDDGVACTIDACDSGTDACTHTLNHGVCSNGLYCDGSEVCHLTQGCQDGPDPDCDDGVACTVDECNEALDICDHIPNNTACSNGLFCDGMEVCDLIAGCVDGNDPDCSDGVACTTDTCNEVTDTCDHAANSAACQDGVFCNGAEVCDPSGGCTAGTPPTCDDGVSCTVDACNATTDACEHFPDDALCSDNLYCTGVETCHPTLGCQDGADPNCDDGVVCTVDSCNEANDVCDHDPDHVSCGNGLFCDGEEVCDPTLGCQDSSDPCAPPTKCDEPNDRCVICTTDAQCNDGVFCNGLETCNVAAGVCVPGTPPSCDDGVGCTLDECSAATDQCEHTPDNGACDDGAFCNGSETCHPTLGCQAGTPPNCDDGVACTVDQCDETNDRCVNTPDNGACDNGLFCDGAETCHPLDGCQVGTPPDCNDAVSCTADSCNEATDMCDHAPSDSVCDDGLYCNGAETCDPLNDCEAGTPPDCNDGVLCTVDACNEPTDSCDHTPTNSLCDDGAYCNGAETCDVLNGCLAGTPPNCDDGVACTDDSCNEMNDTCDHVPQNGLCGNGQFCDGVEVCDPLNGCEPGTPPDCGDGIACTIDACDEVNDVCTHTPNDAACDNMLYCDGTETCDPVNGCMSGPAPNCNDGVDCTVDSCNESLDQCVHSPQDSQCNDGQYCNGAEACDPTNGCQAGTPPNCKDGVGCTVDSCDEATDTCLHQPDSMLCSDGYFCTGAEICMLLSGCTPGPPPDCSDTADCTADACNAVSDHCTHTPNDAACEDNDLCTNEFCDLGGCHYVNDKCGACCLPSGPCMSDVTSEQCSTATAQGGVFQGVGSLCAGMDSDNDGSDDACDLVVTVPTVSEWGLVVLTLMLLIGAKVWFARRPEVA